LGLLVEPAAHAQSVLDALGMPYPAPADAQQLAHSPDPRCGVNPILRRELTNGFGFLQQLQHNLGFEGGSVRLFHAAILPNSGVLTVQILGFTILLRG
jgi:hypothetical protein